MSLTTCGAAYQVCGGDLVDSIFLVGLGIDGPIIGNGFDFLAIASKFGNGVTLRVLELFNELVHDINEDNLQDRLSANSVCYGGQVNSNSGA